MEKEKNSNCKFIFITGGVVSSLGKGVAAATLATLLQARGYKVRVRKLDPYLNIDPGTMSPYQHGEVFITEDGAETDLDLGHYERFTGIQAEQTDSISSGRIYSQLLQNERKGKYLGHTVQVIPHVTDLIKDFILYKHHDLDFMICEIGGTVGDIEALPYFEAIRQLNYQLANNRVAYIHVTLLPYVSSAQELKTKPTQHSVKELLSIGIQPHILLCRADREITSAELSKIGLFCNVKEDRVIQALDQNNIYQIPLAYHTAGLDSKVLEIFNIESKIPNLDSWHQIQLKINNSTKEIKIAIIGKYTKLKDAYKSLNQAFEHAGLYHQCKVILEFFDSDDLNNENIKTIFKNISGIMVPGGFGSRGIEGKILAIQYARENNIPFFGICLGMQLSIIEFARNVAKIENANSSEFAEDCTPVIALMEEWMDENNTTQLRNLKGNLGGTMRLGGYKCSLSPNSLIYSIYQTDIVTERHRHRYEFNNKYLEPLSLAGLRFSGFCVNDHKNNLSNNITTEQKIPSANKILTNDSCLVEAIELPNHPWFIAVQFHPELKSRPFLPHPLFVSFIAEAKKYDTKFSKPNL